MAQDDHALNSCVRTGVLHATDLTHLLAQRRDYHTYIIPDCIMPLSCLLPDEKLRNSFWFQFLPFRR